MIEHFGTLTSGETVEKITLNSGDLTVSVLTLGAILQDVRLDGVPYGLTLGSPDLAGYEGPFMFFGSLIGPVANRIGNARAMLDGDDLGFEANAPGGHTLHSGACGLQHKNWHVADRSATHVVMKTFAENGEGGFPANRDFEARFEVEDGQLTLSVTAQTDASTWVNVVNHSYWNLDGEGSFDGHSLQVEADHYLPLSDELIPTGTAAPVGHTPMDFRKMRRLTVKDHLDNNFCIGNERGPLRPVLRLKGTKGIEMQVETTEPGIQVYDGRGLGDTDIRGHDGRIYGARAGIAIEPQFWPDAPNQPDFPSIRLEPGQTWAQTSRFKFSKE